MVPGHDGRVDVRLAGPGDAPEVIGLWELAGLTRPWNDPAIDFERAVDAPSSAVLVGLEAGTIVATVMAGHDGHRGWVYYLAVDPQQHGHGLGREMMTAAERWLRSRGAAKVQLMVRTSNEQVLDFYEKLGYGREPVHVMSRWLDGDPPRSVSDD